MNLPDKFEILVITLSDRAHNGEYKDMSGPRIAERVSDYFQKRGMELQYQPVPDP